MCTFDGCYYCFECHENQEYYIPAFIIHNWDFRKHHGEEKHFKFNLCKIFNIDPTPPIDLEVQSVSEEIQFNLTVWLI